MNTDGIIRRSPADAGFTLVELMVVIIIIAVLAVAALPVYRSSTRRAIRAEAVAVLGMVRRAQRLYQAEHGVYLSGPGGVVEGTTIRDALLGADAFADVHFFDVSCYDMVEADTSSFSVRARNAAGNSAPGAGRVSGFWHPGATIALLDHDGTLREFD